MDSQQFKPKGCGIVSNPTRRWTESNKNKCYRLKSISLYIVHSSVFSNFVKLILKLFWLVFCTVLSLAPFQFFFFMVFPHMLSHVYPSVGAQGFKLQFLRVIHFHGACQAFTPMTGFDYDLIASCSTVLQDKSGLAQLNSISFFTYKFHYDTHLMLLRLINNIHKSYLRVWTLVRPSLASLESKCWPNRPAFPFLTQTSEPNETLCERPTVHLLEEKRVHPDVSLM